MGFHLDYIGARESSSYLLLVACTLLLVAMPGAPSSVLAPSSKARRAPSSFLLLVVWPGAPSSFWLLVVRPGAPSSVLAPSSMARSA